MISPPDYLDTDAVAVWHRLAPDLEAKGALSEWDVDLFAVYCTAVVHHRRAVELVNQTNVLTKAAGAAHVVKNPALQVVRDQAAILVSLAARFGLSPADRMGLTLGDETDDGEATSFAAAVRTPLGDTPARPRHVRGSDRSRQ